jgi:PASTA domain
MSTADAKKTLKELGLEVEIMGEGETVGDQLPKTGIKINTGTKVTIYAN